MTDIQVRLLLTVLHNRYIIKAKIDKNRHYQTVDWSASFYLVHIIRNNPI